MADDIRHRSCGTMKNHRRLLDADPAYARRLARIEEHAHRSTMMGPMMVRSGCLRIPVVVHVVYNRSEENVSLAQIESQIAVLNRDFRKQNPDVSNVPAPFAPLAADARIEFQLATVDPDGNPTDGITRTNTSATSFDSDDDVKFDEQGGKDAWPSDEYLNLWVCNLRGGLLGYAQFPGGLAATDGVVVTHTGFGTTGTARAPFNLGRTTTHEIGHWLNLRHIWGDDGDGCSGSDFVADTPNQGGDNIGKPTFPSISCNNGPNGDMFMNYMDYVDDDTMVMFTEGQVARMHACLDGPRSSIGESISCAGGSTPDLNKNLPKDLSDPNLKALPKDNPKELWKELPKDPPKDPPKELPKDPPKDPPKELPKEFTKEPPKDGPKEFPKDGPKELPKEFPKDGGKELPKELPKDGGKELPKEFPKDGGKELPKEFPKDGGKEFPKDGPKEFARDTPKDFSRDTKSPLEPGPKSGFDPGPKVFDPGPKGFDPIPKGFDPGPIGPIGPVGPTPMPFVLGTGAAPGASTTDAEPEQSSQAETDKAAMLQHYTMILNQYASLYQSGMLDEQGMQGWRQAYEAYQAYAQSAQS